MLLPRANMSKLLNKGMEGLCRACLSVADPPKSLFSDDGRQETPAYLVWKCTEVLPVEGDRLPDSLCHKCSKYLTIANHFRLLVQNSNRLLLQCVDLTVQLESNLRIVADAKVTTEDVESESHVTSENESEDTEFKNKSDIDISEVKIELDEIDLDNDSINYQLNDYDEDDNVTKENNESEFCIDYEDKKNRLGLFENISISETKNELNKTDLKYDLTDNQLTNCNDNLIDEDQIKHDSNKMDCGARNIPLHNENEPEKHFGNVNQMHMNMNKDNIYVCPLCEFTTLTKISLNQHMPIHEPEKKYACHLCKYVTNVKHNLIRHLERHKSEKKHACRLCKYVTNLKQYLMQHLETHKTEKKYVCDLCKYATNSKQRLIPHIEKHNPVKKHACHLCKYVTNVKQNLMRHLKTHKTEKKLACHLCKYVTNLNRNLIRHLETHKIEKKYACNLCKYATNFKQHLIRHQERHKPGKIRACNLCKYVTKRKHYLTQHQKKHHSEMKQE